jgi:hypothetical protein
MVDAIGVVKEVGKCVNPTETRKASVAFKIADLRYKKFLGKAYNFFFTFKQLYCFILTNILIYFVTIGTMFLIAHCGMLYLDSFLTSTTKTVTILLF